MRREALLLGALGAISGLLTGLIPFSPSFIPHSVYGFHIHEDIAPLHAPFVFAAVIIYGLWRWKHLNPAGALLVVVFTTIAWLLAINTTLNFGDWLGKTFAPGGNGAPLWVFLAAGGAGGLVGSAVTMIGVDLTTPSLRRIGAFVPPVAAGIVAGFLFNDMITVETSIRSTRYIVLFVVWQAAVAAMIGRSLGNAGK